MARKGDVLVWANVHDVKAQIDFDDAYALFEKLGLDTAYLPRRIRAIDAFRKAAADTPGLDVRRDGPYGPRYLMHEGKLVATLTFIPAPHTAAGTPYEGHRVEWAYERGPPGARSCVSGRQPSRRGTPNCTLS